MTLPIGVYFILSKELLGRVQSNRRTFKLVFSSYVRWCGATKPVPGSTAQTFFYSEHLDFRVWPLQSASESEAVPEVSY
jgi:hypothetical protein